MKWTVLAFILIVVVVMATTGARGHGGGWENVTRSSVSVQDAYEACRSDQVCFVGYGEPRLAPNEMETFAFMIRTIDFGPTLNLFNCSASPHSSACQREVILLLMERELLKRGMLCDLGRVPWHDPATGAFECLCRADRACGVDQQDFWLAKVFVAMILLILALHCVLSIMQLRGMGLLLSFTATPTKNGGAANKRTSTDFIECLLRVLYS
jgi:hypothetical protein